jgi:hypothetical protein
MYRRAHAPLLVLGLCLAALTGPAAAEDKERSPFAGKYSGEWTFKSSNALFRNKQRGKLTLSIAASGKVTGTIENLTFRKKADVKGFIDGDGELDVTFEFDNQAYRLKGALTKTKRGDLKGTVSQSWDFAKAYPVGTIELDLPSKVASSSARRAETTRGTSP